MNVCLTEHILYLRLIKVMHYLPPMLFTSYHYLLYAEVILQTPSLGSMDQFASCSILENAERVLSYWTQVLNLPNL